MPRRAIDSVLTKLCQDAAKYFPGLVTPLRVDAVTVVRRPLSDLARVELSFADTATTVYVKVHRKANAPLEGVRRKAGLEFETLSFLYEHFEAIPGYAVVRPIAFFADEMAVVTAAAPGENLHRLLKAKARPWRIGTERERLAEHCRASGMWLRHFQRVTAQPQRQRLRATDFLRLIGTDLKVCVQMGLSTGEAGRLLTYCESELSRLDGRELPVVGVHPDFQPDNILVAKDGVTVLDFTSFHYGAPYHDPARFVATLDAFRRNPLYGRGISDLMTAFLDGYGWSSHEDASLLPIFVVRHLVRITQSVRVWRHRFPINRLVERRAVAFLAGWRQRLEATQAALHMGTAWSQHTPSPRRSS